MHVGQPLDPNANLNNPVNLQPVVQPEVQQAQERPQIQPAVEEESTVGVAQTALVPEKITVELDATQQTKPTMALMKQFLTENNYEYTHVKTFSAKLPKNDQGATRLETFTRRGPDGKEFTCFQGEVTFSVTVEKDGKKQTIEFSQKIETAVKVPMNGDNIEVEAAMKKALFLIKGYRHKMGENFPKDGAATAVNAAGLEALKKLEGTASFKVSTTKTDDPYKFYGRDIRPIELPKDFAIKTLFKRNLEYHPSITSVKLDDGTEVKTTKYWNKKIVCPDINQRNNELDRFVDAAKNIGGDGREPIATINDNIKSKTPSGMTTDEAITVIVRNTQNDIYELKDVGLEADKKQIEYSLEQAKKNGRAVGKLEAEIKKLEKKDENDPIFTGTSKQEALAEKQKQLEKHVKDADYYTNAAIRDKKALTNKLEKINNTIEALEKLVKTDGINLTDKPDMNDEIKARHKENLKELKKILSENVIAVKINKIPVPESLEAVNQMRAPNVREISLRDTLASSSSHGRPLLNLEDELSIEESIPSGRPEVNQWCTPEMKPSYDILRHGVEEESEKSIDELKQHISNNKTDHKAFAQLANLIAETENSDDIHSMLDLLEAAIEAKPNDAFFHALQGEIQSLRGDTDGAIASHNKALELEPNNAFAHAGLGAALVDKEKFDEAESHLKKAIEIDPGYRMAYAHLGKLKNEQNELPEAKAHFKKVVELAPNNDVARALLGEVLYKLGDLEDAIVHLQKAVDLDPEHQPYQELLTKAKTERAEQQKEFDANIAKLANLGIDIGAGDEGSNDLNALMASIKQSNAPKNDLSELMDSLEGIPTANSRVNPGEEEQVGLPQPKPFEKQNIDTT